MTAKDKTIKETVSEGILKGFDPKELQSLKDRMTRLERQVLELENRPPVYITDTRNQ